MINANRNLGRLRIDGRAGVARCAARLRRAARRLSGRARALRDALPRDRAVRLAALPARPGRAPRARRSSDADAEIAMAKTRDADGEQVQPVFCLMKTDADGKPGALHARQAGARSIAGPRCTAAPKWCSTTRRPSSTPTRSPSCSSCKATMPEPMIIRRARRRRSARLQGLARRDAGGAPRRLHVGRRRPKRASRRRCYASRFGLERPEGGHFTLGAWHGERLVGAITCDREQRSKVRHIGHLVGMMVDAERKAAASAARCSTPSSARRAAATGSRC